MEQSTFATPAEAKAAGRKRYYTGVPCKNGHLTERLASTAGCIGCRSGHQAAYKTRNPESAKANKRRTETNNREKHLAGKRRRGVGSYQRNKTNKQRYNIENRISVLARQKSWRINNRAIRAAHNTARRARQLQACPQWANLTTIREIYEFAALLSGRHVDHILPLNSPVVCGLHIAANLQVIPAPENLAKKNTVSPELLARLEAETTFWVNAVIENPGLADLVNLSVAERYADELGPPPRVRCVKAT